MKHVLSAKQFSQEEINDLFKTVEQIKKEYKEHRLIPHKYCSGYLLGALFFEPSTRTRWSTEAAMIKLGGQVLSMESAKDSSSDKKGESLADTLRTCSGYVDVLLVRHPEAGLIETAADASEVPVINGGDGANEHPTQSLLDLYTILQHFPDPTGLSIMLTGDMECSRTIRSLLYLLKHYKMKITVTNYAVGNEYGSTFYCSDEKVYSRLPETDILYQTRHQTERQPTRDNSMMSTLCPQWKQPEPRKKSTFKMTWALAETMKKNAIIMHPLPRNDELPTEVDSNPRAIYFETG